MMSKSKDWPWRRSSLPMEDLIQFSHRNCHTLEIHGSLSWQTHVLLSNNRILHPCNTKSIRNPQSWKGTKLGFQANQDHVASHVSIVQHTWLNALINVQSKMSLFLVTDCKHSSWILTSPSLGTRTSDHQATWTYHPHADKDEKWTLEKSFRMHAFKIISTIQFNI